MQTSLPYDYPNLDAKIRIQKNTKSPLGTVHSISFSPQSTKVQSWTQSWDNLCTKSMLTFFQFSQPAYFCFVFCSRIVFFFFIFIPTFGPNAFLTPLFNPTVCLCWNHITVGHTCRVTEYNRWVIGFLSQQSDRTIDRVCVSKLNTPRAPSAPISGPFSPLTYYSINPIKDLPIRLY